jgi:hypothetical protein
MVDDLLTALGQRQQETGRAPTAERNRDVPTEATDSLFDPFEGDDRESLLDEVFERVDAATGEAAPAGPEDSDASSPSVVVPLSPRRRAMSTWIGVAAALAAALLLWWGLTRGGASSPTGDAMPLYSVTRFDGGPAQMRSAEPGVAASTELSADDPVRWEFSPKSAVRTPVAVAILASRPGAEAILARPQQFEVSPDGVVRIEGPLSQVVALTPGHWMVTIIIAPESALPKTVDEATRPANGSRVALDVTVTAAAP